MKFAKQINKKFFGILFFAAIMSFGIVACGGEKDSAEDAADEMEESMDEAKEDAKDMMDDAKDKADEMTDEAKEAMDSLSDDAKKKMEEMKGKEEHPEGGEHPNN
jgi:gas vesicle protein